MVLTKAPHLIGVATTFLVLTWTFTALRVYVRCAISKRWGWDDTLLLAALCTFTAEVSCFLSAIPCGLGRHLSDIPVENFSRCLLIWWICDILYLFTTLLLRFSIALFILRICAKRIHKIIVYSTVAAIFVFSIVYFFLLVLRCTPPTHFWTQFESNTAGTCLEAKVVIPDASYAYSAVSAAADWILGILPVWLIWDLKMNTRTKISICVLLSFGMIAGLAALIRIPFIYELTLSDENDFFWYNIDVAIWSAIEPGLGITATAACVLRPLLRKFYSLSSYKTNKLYDANPHRSAWLNDRASHRSKPFLTENSYRTRNERIQMDVMEGVVTSVLGNHQMGRTREWTKKNHIVSRSRVGNESEEELTREAKGIVIQQTVEIRSHESGVTQEGLNGNSIDSENKIGTW